MAAILDVYRPFKVGQEVRYSQLPGKFVVVAIDDGLDMEELMYSMYMVTIKSLADGTAYLVQPNHVIDETR